MTADAASTETESADDPPPTMTDATPLVAQFDSLEPFVHYFRILLEWDARRPIMASAEGDQIDEFDVAA